MNTLKITLYDNKLKNNFQLGMTRLLEVPCYDDMFFAYLITLGGGLVDKDMYELDFELLNSKAYLSSQSNQKIYKGKQKLNTKITLNNSSLIFHNDANIFYEDANFNSTSTIYFDSLSKFIYIDGGFIGYSKAKFKANLRLKLFINYKLIFNDNFIYENINSLLSNLNYEYFYNLILNENIDIKEIFNENIIITHSNINNILIVRILSNSNDLAMSYINDIKQEFLLKQS
ncbi:urease accessory protein UreD [Campylobacter sp. MG1]|uniref:urease accessory protein UreD n=1 Tax=Campylobacter sp. MG1 TaxID=2976332 RepID=UPI00226D1B3B|nr:urease accessory protein UreD [Campylobacter sp. MG1]